MSAAKWERSIRPDQRDGRWNAMLDYLADEYRGLEPGDELIGVCLMVRDGVGQGWAVVRIEGTVCRIPVSEEWLGVRPEPDTGQVA